MASDDLSHVQMHSFVLKRLETACRCHAQPVDLELQPCSEKVLRLVGPADLIPSIFENCYEKRRCGGLYQWEVCSVTFPDVEQELLLFWRGDVKAGIINRDGFGAAERKPAGAEEQDTKTTLDMG